MSAVIGGGTNAATTSLRIPSTLAPGTYYIGAIADSSYTNAESNESNNMSSVEITIQ